MTAALGYCCSHLAGIMLRCVQESGERCHAHLGKREKRRRKIVSSQIFCAVFLSIGNRAKCTKFATAPVCLQQSNLPTAETAAFFVEPELCWPHVVIHLMREATRYHQGESFRAGAEGLWTRIRTVSLQ